MVTVLIKSTRETKEGEAAKTLGDINRAQNDP